MKNNNFKIKATALAVATVLLVTPLSTLAVDAFNGVVKGSINTSNNQMAAGAIITLKHKGKGITRKVTVEQDGSYVLRKLPVGHWTMSIEKDGYQLIQEQDVHVKIGSNFIYNGLLIQSGTDIERIAVSGSKISRVNTSSSTSGITVTSDELAYLPVDNGFENIALLSPGAGANSEFDAASIGGASSAENGYYLNGLNVTSIRRGIGSIDLPFEAIAQTEIKNGGVEPEFGGAMGGIVNTISKSGSNEFEFGMQLRTDPDVTRSQHNNLMLSDGTIAGYGASEDDKETYNEARIWVSGALIDDKLFAYALFSPQRNNYENAKTTTLNDGREDSDQWFAKLDYYINDNHSIELTGINFENNGSGKSYTYESLASTQGEYKGDYKEKSGGQVYGVKYTGLLTDDISIDVIAGRTKENDYNSATSSLPSVNDERSGSSVTLSDHTSSTITDGTYIRDQFRVDLNWDLEDHSLKFGLDSYDINVNYAETQNGAGDAKGWWTIATAGEADRSGQMSSEDYVEQRIRTTFTDSKVSSMALYAQDSWQVNDELVLNLGVRVSNISNTVSDGRKYVDIKNQIAPRLQAIYDVSGDGTAKVFATFGRYFQPVSANMNIKQGATQRETLDYYELGEVDANGTPILLADGSPSRGGALRDTFVRQAGIDDPNLIVSDNLDSMYSDEFTLGYQQEVFNGDMTLGVRATYRELKRSVEDTDVGPVLRKWFEENGVTDEVGQWGYYVLLNPGADLNMIYDFDQDGTAENINISASELDLPTPKRKYGSLEFTLDGSVTEDLTINSSYTWSHSWGNTEGLVKTDNGQADPGWTTSYDYGDLMDHSSGDLPNDRRHSFKVSGSYRITDDLSLGFASRINSGTPVSKLSWHPFDQGRCTEGNIWDSCISYYYDDASFYDADGNPAPRGSAGRTPWTKEIDLSLLYQTEIFDGNLSLKASIYNLFNEDTATSYIQKHQANSDSNAVNAEWGTTNRRLASRYMSLTARYIF
ncbi:TonB-dependent receptor [Pseudoalteromonas sp. NBT06-2]|uniref:TonB-dependent receptor n=1 Tax=Pseudoalteromonas sp. NBT06-2 TaxID=2025950 RepID=UPI000BA6DB68|nr:TonB-dependent receptor [Pseudoalteromonas sp. NBT06-2]PAJ76366.1 TonB-dependent receptor [Pseudoalteromonas sp. NBT06-2]